MTRGVFDPVTGSLESYAAAHLGEVFASCRPFALRAARKLTLPVADPDIDSPEGITSVNDEITREIRRICRAHRLFPLLILARKVPKKAVDGFLYWWLQLGKDTPFSRAAVHSEAILFATNSILAFSRNDMSVHHEGDRYAIKPSDGEMRDAIRLVLLSSLHRYQLFYLNAATRAMESPAVSINELVEAHSIRLQRSNPRSQRSLTATSLVAAGSLLGTGDQPTKIQAILEVDGPVVTLILSNYLPGFYDGTTEFRRYSYLGEGGDFQFAKGLSFEEWWKGWLFLNQALITPMAAMELSDDIYDATSVVGRARLRLLFDLAETGLLSFPRSVVRDHWAKQLVDHAVRDLPTAEDYRMLIDSITCEALSIASADFIEQPYTMYRVGPDQVLWDVLRHKGVIKAIARSLIGSPVGTAKGEVGERVVKDLIQERIPRSSALLTDVKIKDPTTQRDALQIDVGFVVDHVLILAEVKWHFQSVRLLTGDPGVVGSHMGRLLASLRQRDDRLLRYRAQVAAKWQGHRITGALFVVLTEEVEFANSADPAYWLDLSLRIPRICLPEELFVYLDQRGVAALDAHPSFVPFEHDSGQLQGR